MAWRISSLAATTEALIRFRREFKFILSYCHEIGMQRRWGEGSRSYDVQLTSTDSCRKREIEVVGTVELVWLDC